MLSKDIPKQETDPNSTPIWQNYGGCRRLRTEGNVSQERLLLTIGWEVSSAGEKGPPPPAKCRYTQRRSPWHEPILHYHSDSFLLILVEWGKSALLCKLALFQARVFLSVCILSRTHFVIRFFSVLFLWAYWGAFRLTRLALKQ